MSSDEDKRNKNEEQAKKGKKVWEKMLVMLVSSGKLVFVLLQYALYYLIIFSN